MDKLLSIIIPSYNMERYLPKCLSSLIIDDKELLQKLDIIVVNDGSKDRTSEIAHEYEAKYPGIFRVIDKPNGHYGSCINAALPTAKGRYVKILDADDFVNAANFRPFVKWLESEQSDLVVAPFCFVDEQGVIFQEVDYKDELARQLSSIDEISEISFLPIHAIAYKASIFAGNWYKQLEGIAYTDCQWCSVPMLRVRSLHFFNRPITCYLVGREGQSVDPAVRMKGLSQQFVVNKELARIYALGKPKEANEGAWAYFKRLYYAELSNVLRAMIIGVNGAYSDKATCLAFFDEIGKVDRGWREHIHVPVRYFGNHISYDLGQSYFNDVGLVYHLKLLSYRLYRWLRL